ncbi:MAG: hypothetical protein JW755_09145 [Candidatus Aminicenantes bacterium]|nr:hypothetical protein [Candidatus Aminicenantes bacterium]
MWIFNSFLQKIFDVIFYPFRGMSPWVGMIVISLLSVFLILFIFKHTSNQTGIRKVKDKIKAHLLELRLYKDNLSISLKAQGNILRQNSKYIAYSAKPMLFMIIPIILIIAHTNFWFSYASLEPGQKTLVKVKLKENYDPLETDIRLEPSPAYVIETPPLRILEENEIDWRISALETGEHDLVFSVAGNNLKKSLSVQASPLSRISPVKLQKNFIDELINPTESPIDENLPIKSVEILYPTKNMNFLGLGIHWLIVYFILTIILGFSLKSVFKVEV